MRLFGLPTIMAGDDGRTNELRPPDIGLEAAAVLFLF